MNESPDDNSTCKFYFKLFLITLNKIGIVFVCGLCLSIEKFFFSPLIVIISSHQLNSIVEQSYESANDESSSSVTLHSSARSQRRLMPTSCTYWLNTDVKHNTTTMTNKNNSRANFMCPTYSAKYRAHLSHSIEQCPRVYRGIRSSLSIDIDFSFLRN